MHTNHSFVVVAAVKAQFREPSLLQGCWYNPEGEHTEPDGLGEGRTLYSGDTT